MLHRSIHPQQLIKTRNFIRNSRHKVLDYDADLQEMVLISRKNITHFSSHLLQRLLPHVVLTATKVTSNTEASYRNIVYRFEQWIVKSKWPKAKCRKKPKRDCQR